MPSTCRRWKLARGLPCRGLPALGVALLALGEEAGEGTCVRCGRTVAQARRSPGSELLLTCETVRMGEPPPRRGEELPGEGALGLLVPPMRDAPPACDEDSECEAAFPSCDLLGEGGPLPVMDVVVPFTEALPMLGSSVLFGPTELERETQVPKEALLAARLPISAPPLLVSKLLLGSVVSVTWSSMMALAGKELEGKETASRCELLDTEVRAEMLLGCLWSSAASWPCICGMGKVSASPLLTSSPCCCQRLLKSLLSTLLGSGKPRLLRLQRGVRSPPSPTGDGSDARTASKAEASLDGESRESSPKLGSRSFQERLLGDRAGDRAVVPGLALRSCHLVIVVESSNRTSPTSTCEEGVEEGTAAKSSRRTVSVTLPPAVPSKGSGLASGLPAALLCGERTVCSAAATAAFAASTTDCACPGFGDGEAAMAAADAAMAAAALAVAV